MLGSLASRWLPGLIALANGAASSGQADEFPLPQGRVRILLDTDAGNYYDDQFALAYAGLSGESIEIEAAYAAPFTNSRVADPAEGMERSFDEIAQVLRALRSTRRVPVARGARRWLDSSVQPVRCPAVEDMVERVMYGRQPIDYVVAIGAATNLASALLLEPAMATRTNPVWLGGTPHGFPSASEFNLRQDPIAARVLFDSGARLVHVPAVGVAENLRASRPELEDRMSGVSSVADLLLDRVNRFSGSDAEAAGASKTLPIWDMAPIAWLVNPDWVESTVRASPTLSDSLTWMHSPYRHRIRLAYRVLRDEVLTDFFRKVESASS